MVNYRDISLNHSLPLRMPTIADIRAKSNNCLDLRNYSSLTKVNFAPIFKEKEKIEMGSAEPIQRCGARRFSRAPQSVRGLSI
jgi:hypothetical protein